MTNKWADVNGEHYDAERIAKWFFQVDDPRQKECEKLVEAALAKEARDTGAREAAIRLDEAQWWHPGKFSPNPANIYPDPQDFHYAGCQCQGCGRIVELEAGAARDAAKETR